MKLSRGRVEEPSQVRYGNVFGRDDHAGRLNVGLDAGHLDLLLALTAGLAGPFQLLYVLHTSRTGARLARYESPELSLEELAAFLHRFGGFIGGDSRHDLWVRSHDDDVTLVLDRHDLIYAYGPLDDLERLLMAQGLEKGPPPQIDFPHNHHYHSHWDPTELEILEALPWVAKPLRGSDLQRVDAGVLLDGVRELLRAWDPIGVFDEGADEAPLDEYDSYAPRILAELQRGTDEGRLAAALSQIEHDDLGITPDEPRNRATALRIAQWWSSLPSHG